MIWYEHLFLGTGCQSKQRMLRRRITGRKPHPNVFLITLPVAEHRVLEIVPSALLLQKTYPADHLRIVGMAFTRLEALALTQRIIAESFRFRGDADIEAFLRDRAEQGKESL